MGMGGDCGAVPRCILDPSSACSLAVRPPSADAAEQWLAALCGLGTRAAGTAFFSTS